MIGMQYKHKHNNNGNINLQGGGRSSCWNDGNNMNEPISVLDTWSPSPSTSTSTLNNNTTQQGNNMVVNAPLLHNAGLDLSEKSNLGLEGFHNFSESAKQNEILKLLLQNDVNNPNFTQFCGANVFSSNNDTDSAAAALGLSDSGFSLYDDDNKGKTGLAPYYITFPPSEFDTLDQKVEIYNPAALSHQILVQNQDMNDLHPLLFGTQQHPLNSNLVDPGHELIIMPPTPIKQQSLPPTTALFFQPPNFIPPHMPLLVPKQETTAVNEHHPHPHPPHHHQQQQQLIVYDQLYKAAELVQAGNFCNAQGILARLNQILSPIGKPFERSAFYVTQALELAFTTMPNQVSSLPPKIPSPFDGMFKMGAYKVFSEVSPFIRFSNFTANQVLLEALDGAQQIHIIDFDIGFGAHWSSFLQELPRNNRGVTSVKITAFASPSTHHSVEISLMHENLTQFANELGINFELEVVNIDSFDPNLNSVSSFRSSETEAIAVNFPVWSFANYLSALPSYLCFIKKLSPKILVSLDCGCERIDLPFPRHILHTLQYYEALLDSVDAANLTSEATNKIEKFLFQPRIESTVVGRLVYPHIIPPWRNLVTSAGFVPASLSTFAETQAECVLKKTQVRGFHVERRNASLVLSWQRGELLSVSAWN
ncbi:hypothetical protein BUALT_Bualt05G0075300 [Buddleja alternifolia]|uniref:Scarecrow-like protein 6 n=1 Tax=Buddleja alternifolia TaxID=168488 RepID=A0AAV6XIW4_9LAMI|nr:hypothetical protein BUALT_Bualt05G0075300 [Buddleja alternifolia]